MKMTNAMLRRKRFMLLLVLVALLAAGCGLSEEPEIVQEISLPTPAPPVSTPGAMPNLTAGAFFYAEHCAMCHGPGGAGDGEMMIDGRLPTAPPSFADPVTVRDQTPLDYMRAITEGNLDAAMPPFSSYSTEERWNVTAYVYTGSLTDEQLALGQQVYEAECLGCHGETGEGDGPDAESTMPSFANLDNWAETSDTERYVVVSEGAGDRMDAYADVLSEDEIWAVLGYARTFAMTGNPGFIVMGADMSAEAIPTDVPVDDAQEPAPEATAVAAGDVDDTSGEDDAAVDEAAGEDGEPEVISVTGLVTNGTPDGPIPTGITVNLHGFDPPDFTETVVETTLQEDGSYAFTDIAHVPGRVYWLSLEYQDVLFGSTVYQPEAFVDGALETAIEVFEMTTDPSVVRVTSGVMRITFSHFGLEVSEVLIFENSSDQLYLSDMPFSDNQRVALQIPLPPGAFGVSFEAGMDGTRFHASADGSTVFDTQPLRPGTEEVVVSFLVPYTDGAIIEQEFLYPVQGPFHLLVEAGQVAVESEMFASAGDVVPMGDATFEAFVAEVDLPAGDVVRYTLTGMPDAVAANQPAEQTVESLSPVVLLLAVGGLILIGVGGFMFLLRQGEPAPAADEAPARDERRINALLDEIAELDDQHERGGINHDYYQRMRARLKEELTELMQGESSGGAADGG